MEKTTEAFLTVVTGSNSNNIPGWPTSDLNGVFDALSRWTLDPFLEGNPKYATEGEEFEPFSCKAWTCDDGKFIPELNVRQYKLIAPIHPEAPDAISFEGNFIGYSFGFRVETNDVALMEKLRKAIADNMARDEYKAEKLKIRS